jgi:hypothetical protein
MQKDNESIRFRVNQLTDTGANVALALSEDVELETITQQQMMLEAIDASVPDNEVKEQIKPLLEAILKSQPQTMVRSYPQTIIQITMPKKKYENLGSPRVGELLTIEITKSS